ncbi:MAG: hypothetical protein N3J91_13925 [Verrucomicrobiae bacterium]|nr:hypothetical protein [Verrucomicrobiae bacterium]
MGYAKYKEDIEKIHSQNIFGTWLDFQADTPVPHHRCPFCSFETTAKEQLETHFLKDHRDAAIFLEHDDRIVPDRAVFRVRPVHLKVRCPALPNGIEVSVTSKLRSREENRFKDGQLLTITPADEEIVLLVLGIGVFKREYAVSFKRQVFQARLTPYLIECVSRANTSISTWAWPNVVRFELDVMNEPGLSTDEERHRLAIYEYYLGLWLEQNQKSEYARHLEKSFDVLRDFDDPLALLISSYFLYRVNSFGSISPRLPFPRLRRVAAFFGTNGSDMDASMSGHDAGQEFVPCEIAITDGDASIFDAVSAVMEGKPQEALGGCEEAEQRITPGDDQAKYRLWFLRYRTARALGRSTEAKFFAEQLAHCTVESFRKEANRFLKGS